MGGSEYFKFEKRTVLCSTLRVALTGLLSEYNIIDDYHSTFKKKK